MDDQLAPYKVPLNNFREIVEKPIPLCTRLFLLAVTLLLFSSDLETRQSMFFSSGVLQGSSGIDNIYSCSIDDFMRLPSDVQLDQLKL